MGRKGKCIKKPKIDKPKVDKKVRQGLTEQLSVTDGLMSYSHPRR